MNKNIKKANCKIEKLSLNKVAVNNNNKHPIFSLEKLEGDYCLSKCNKDEKAAFADKLHELSKLTWQSLCEAHRHGLGFEKINDYKLPNGVSPDVKIVAFRFSGLKAMVGYRIEQTFYIIALDRNFTAYKHS